MDSNHREFEGKNVLLIDDDLTQLKLMEGLLKKIGFSVSAFNSPVQALMNINPDTPPDIVITDIYMPEINGWELCRCLRSDVMPYTKEVPILIVSSVFLGDGILKTAHEAGADDFIEMPIEPEILFAKIRKVFEDRRKEEVTNILWVAPCTQCTNESCAVIPMSKYKIEHVATIKQAIKSFLEKNYDLVVISHKLYEDPTLLIKKIAEKNANTVVIAILHGKSRKELVYWLKKGVSAIIKEPVTTEHVINLYQKTKLEKNLIQTKELLEQKIREKVTEELKWASILDAIPSGVFIKGENLQYIRVNKSYANFFNKNHKEFGIFNDTELFDESSAEKFISICKEVLKGNIYQNSDFTLSISGEEKIFNAFIAPLRDAEEKIIGVYGTLQDVTETRKLQQNYKNLFESMQEAFAEHEFIFDEHGIPVDYRFLVANDAFQKMTGLKLQNILGKTVKEVLPNIEQFWILTYAQVVITGNPVTFEMFTNSLNRHYLVHAFKTGENRFACVFTDITEKKKFEEEIKRLNREWQIAYDNINSVIWFLNKNFEITRTNNAIIKLFHLTPDEVLGKKCWEIVHETREAPSFCPVIRLLKSRKRETLEFRKDDRWFEVVVDPVLDNNQLVGFIHILSDITERKKEEKDKEEMQKQLVLYQKLDTIGKLVGGVAHDFNNMLSVIVGNIELSILKSETGEPIKENLEEIRKAVERASELTKKILAFGQKQDIKPKVLNLNNEISTYIKLLRRVIPERIYIEWTPCEDLWNVYLDPSHLDIILLNLCVNARDAIPTEGKITIEVANRKTDTTFNTNIPGFLHGEYVILRVSDTGMGIDPEIMPKIFEPYFTTKKQGEGTGLGLATVYGTVRQNNGFITVESIPGKGTTFTIYLPRYKNEKGEEENSTENWDIQLYEIPEEKRGAVLIIDDEKTVLEILNKIISRMGFEPILTTDPIEALERAKENKNKIKLLISDIVLPVMNGFDLSKKIEEIIPSLKT
ncbi:MAG: hybrid sensor histidine kinase/response regulator, partial [Candidatus Hydrogenedens sp.]